MSCISPEGDVYQAGTLSGNPIAMSAGIAALTQCLRPNFYIDLEAKTQRLVNEINAYAIEKKYLVHFATIGSIFWIAFSSNKNIQSSEEIDADSMKHFRKLHAYLLENGIYLGPSGYEVGFISSSHTDDNITEAINKIKSGLDFVFA
jgi:glutamate-1-semialdehyde 2,1-aminomutase